MEVKDSPQADSSTPSLPTADASAKTTVPDKDGGQPTDRLIVAGIGASAGGIEALRAFFEALPENLGVAFVVVVHLSPEHRSYLAEILAACTKMPVEQVRKRVSLAANHIYVIPPDQQLEITDSQVGTLPFTKPRGQRTPIDLFFRSLAQQHGDGFGVILSGGGSDGALGIKAIKEGGGLILVQDPQEAAYASMPNAAIATGVVDAVLPIRELASRLADLTHLKRRIQQRLGTEPPAVLDGDDEQTLARILAHLHTRTSHDFSKYKRTTVVRRLGRRMQIQRKETLGDYLAFLRQNVEEVQALFHDLLISVTTFFRDPEAFEALREQVISKFLEAEAENSHVRVWVPACATGEEAYSIAILLLEEAERREVWPTLRIFASDLDEGALATAREGRYPLTIEADVSPERLQRFFVKEDHHYRVAKEVRDCVLFATHSVLRDPPFSRLNLVSCRNLLIYLDRDLQQYVFDVLHYALRPSGYLFVGSAETVEHSSFRPLDKKHCLYQVRQKAPHELLHLPDLMVSPLRSHLPAGSKRSRRETPPAPVLHQKLLEELAPPSLLVDEKRHVLHLSETAGRFFQPSSGVLSHDVTELVRPELRPELRAALYRAFEQNETGLSPFIPVQFNGTPRQVAVLVQPRRGEGDGERLALVVFLDGGQVTSTDIPPGGEASPEALYQLQEELRQMQTQMDVMQKEHGAAHEEILTANEELQSVNEEYRSTVEELETSKEELQSLNEELETVNSELRHRLEELSLTHNDLENLMTATEIATLFLDLDLHIYRFTPRLADLFRVTGNDLGRPIGDFTHRLDYEGLEADARQVIKQLMHLEREVRSQDGGWYLVRYRPYRTGDNKIAGVVITFVDVTERKRAEAEVQAARVYAERIVETVHEALVILNPDLRVKSANAAFYEQFRVRPQETEGRLIYELGNGQWNIPELCTLLEAVLPENSSFTDYEVSHDFQSIGPRVMLLNGRRLDHVQHILLTIEDVTKRRQAETQLRQLASRLTLAEQAERHRLSQLLHEDVQQILYAIQLKLGFVNQSIETGQREQLRGQAEQTIALIDEAIAKIRQLSVDLSPPVLPHEGLAEALGWLVTQMRELHGLRVEVEAEQRFRLADEGLRMLLFQIIRELLFNVVKHAATHQAKVTLRQEADQLVIGISDDGRGFEVEPVEAGRGNGLGLHSVRERLGLIGGHMAIVSKPGDGTQIIISVPVTPQKP